jgi:hypothetical protein
LGDALRLVLLLLLFSFLVSRCVIGGSLGYTQVSKREIPEVTWLLRTLEAHSALTPSVVGAEVLARRFLRCRLLSSFSRRGR